MTGTKTYKITFKAELTEDDLNAMQSCFYQAMNEAMEIEEVWGLEIEEDKEEDFIEPNNGFYHIHDCVDALKSCDNIAEVRTLIDNFPCKFGDWWVDIDEDTDGNAFYVVTNKWWDKQAKDYQIDTYELGIEVEDEE
jgi:hypothetical protein